MYIQASFESDMESRIECVMSQPSDNILYNGEKPHLIFILQFMDNIISSECYMIERVLVNFKSTLKVFIRECATTFQNCIVIAAMLLACIILEPPA